MAEICGLSQVAIKPILNQVIGRELYDHHGDAGDLDFPGENFNVVNVTANAEVVQQMHQRVLDYIQLK